MEKINELVIDVEASIEAQRKYVMELKVPLFAPSSGECYNCHRQIYERISVEEASTSVITECPYCDKSFVD